MVTSSSSSRSTCLILPNWKDFTRSRADLDQKLKFRVRVSLCTLADNNYVRKGDLRDIRARSWGGES